MAQLICRMPMEALPSLQQARAAGVNAWLVGAILLPEGTLKLEAPASWLRQPESSLPFCLEWQLPHALTPAQERGVADQLAVWLASPSYLLWHGRPPLWIADPERLIHLEFSAQRLRRRLGPQVLLWGGGPLGIALDGRYERPERDIPCRDLHGDKRQYGSFLFHAHHRSSGDAEALLIPTVQPCEPQEADQHYQNATAANYQEWLALSIAWADLRDESGEGGWVLVNQWFGHRRWFKPLTTVKFPARSQQIKHQNLSCSWGQCLNTNPAVVIHGFHLDLLPWLLGDMNQGGDSGLDLYVSTPEDQFSAAAALLQQLGWKRVNLVGVENRGRDMAPFLLELLPRVMANGHPWLLKIHTKRSAHLVDGDLWAEYLRASLATSSACSLFSDWFARDKGLGLIVPSGTLMPCSLSLHQNSKHLRMLLPRLGIRGGWLLEQVFVAGSMFAIRSEALKALCALDLNLNDFEPEHQQCDGTLAHALERLIAAVTLREGLQIKELPGSSVAVPQFGHAWDAPVP